jgi:UDP-4-amino-4,6-dideoxy-N-acetyl-beta-L-altrosamine transaminase
LKSRGIPYSRQHIDDDDINAVIAALQSDYITQGKRINEFEEKFADYTGSQYAVAVANGTAALHLSAMALNIEKGQSVITTPLTFAATANCIRYCGGDVQFVDIDPSSFCIDLNQVEDLLKKNHSRHFKGVIPVDFAGYPVNLEALKIIADKFGVWILEDACHAPGAYFIDSSGKKQVCGNSRYADLAIFSFHAVKHITTGEGGIITTNNESLAARLKRLRTHGITKDKDLLIENHGGWYYEFQELGFNYRITDFQCALGISQLKKAERWLEKRKRIARAYSDAFKSNPNIKIPYQSENISHAWHLYVILAEKRDELYKYLHQNNIYVQIHYIPLHLQPYYKNLGWQKGNFPKTEYYYDKCLSIPAFPSLTTEEQNFVINTILDFYQKTDGK